MIGTSGRGHCHQGVLPRGGGCIPCDVTSSQGSGSPGAAMDSEGTEVGTTSLAQWTSHVLIVEREPEALG